MRTRLRLRLPHLYLLEAALVGVFFVQALRFLIGMMYSRMGSISVVTALDPTTIPPDTPGAISPSVITNEIMFLVYMLALPLLALILGRFRWLMLVGVVLAAAGRALMIADTSITPVTAATMVLGSGLLYLAMLIRHRAQLLPVFFILGLAFDQLWRAFGNTYDPTWSASTRLIDTSGLVITYFDLQIVLSALLVVMGLLTILGQQREARNQPSQVSPDYGLMTFWGGIGLGGLLFLELSLLSLPNALAGRADVDYTTFAPFVALATLLPLIPWVRGQARTIITIFDGGVRGWLWMLLIALLVVFGTRFQGLAAGATLVIAQFTASLIWWWLARPQVEKERNFSALWLVLGMGLFFALVAADNFTYEYAYVRNFGGDFTFLNNVIPPFLRGFRGMGLGILLLSIFLAALPMVRTQRRIPWMKGQPGHSFLALLLALAVTGAVAIAVRPPVVAGVRGVDRLRVGTYNIHGGFNEFYHYDLEAIARTIQQSGANVVLVQQTEAGRLTSFGVDQPLWLARRLGMDRRFYPTNEGLQGLAVLSNVEIVYDDGELLTSVGNQTGLQRVQIRPDAGVITLYNTWLGFLSEMGDGRSIEQQEQDQQRQLIEVFSIISRHHPNGELGRIIVGGTFNNIPDSPLGDQMRAAGFTDPFAGLPLDLTATLWRAGQPRVQIDYLWTRPPLFPIGANAIDTNASDHRMAVIETLITRGAQ